MLKHSIRFTIPILMLTLLLSACGATTNAGSRTSTPTSTPSPAASLLRRSVAAMQAITTIHFAINEVDKNMFPPSAIKIANTSDAPVNVPANIASMLQNMAPAASQAIGVRIKTTTISGDQIVPDQSQEHVDIQEERSIGSGSFNEYPIRIFKTDKVYLMTESGKWWFTNKKDMQSPQGQVQYIDNSVNQVTVQMKLALQLGQINDQGTKIIQGKQLRHLSVTIGMSALPARLTNGYLDSDIYSVTKNMKLNLDFWIDPGNAYLYKQSMDLRYRVSSTIKHGPADFVSEVTRTTELSQFNQPVTITPPENATDMTNLTRARI